MLLTVEQASNRPCPLMTREKATMYCQADYCPMWRHARRIHANDEPPPAGPELGYCGLAGKPEER